MTELNLSLADRGYRITVGAGAIKKAKELFNLNRKVFIVTDSGVPKEYSLQIKDQCDQGIIYTVPMGEASKSLSSMEKICSAMMDFGMSRKDCVIAVGGGVVGDLAGFSAASYMRGIDFYNVPTTLLAQVDSSIGGKTAVNLGTVKNIIGAFHQPKGVIIDTDVLKTLSPRLFAAGLAEAIKMSLTSDKALFEIFEKEGVNDQNLETVIVRSLKIKEDVVEKDEKEAGLRKILNFGHTFGHGIEAEKKDLYHGECVSLGMLPMCSPEVESRLIAVLKKFELPTEFNGSINKMLEFCSHDKKSNSNGISVIFVNEVGTYEIKELTYAQFNDHIMNYYSRRG